MATTNPNMNTGSFIATTNVWDTSQLEDIDVNSPEFKELLVRLYQNINNIVLILNTKDTGIYSQTEFINTQQYFPQQSVIFGTNQETNYRTVYRKVINFGALPNAGSKSVAHNIPVDERYSLTRLYASATNPVSTFSLIPIPFASPVLNENIKIEMTGTNITITTGINRTAYTICYVVAEYIITNP